MARLISLTPSSSVLLFIITMTISSNASYNVVNFGAKPDGKTDSTKPFLQAWSWACSSTTPATIYVPWGNFLIMPVIFGGPCKSKIEIWIDGTLLAPWNYWDLGNSGYWIQFDSVDGITINGGTVDARGADFWACRSSGKSCPQGARSVSFSWSKNVEVNGLKSINSQAMHMAIFHCEHIWIRNVTIWAPSDSPNTDGIVMQSTNGVTIAGSNIMTGDDCIAIGQGTANVWIEHINCGPGHGISIGSLGDSENEEGVENVTVRNSNLTDTQNGVRIKSWARPCNGYARNVSFQQINIQNVQNPIVIDQNYCPGGKGCPNQGSGVQISKVTYQNIWGSSATQVSMTLNCSASNPCKEIILQDIALTYNNGQSSTAYCEHAFGNSYGVVKPKSCL